MLVLTCELLILLSRGYPINWYYFAQYPNLFPPIKLIILYVSTYSTLTFELDNLHLPSEQ